MNTPSALPRSTTFVSPVTISTPASRHVAAIDAARRFIDLAVDEAELATRRAAWRAPEPRYTQGALAKYARAVGSADRGAVTW